MRSFDRTMPEEINRLLTDQIADALFTPSRDVDGNLLHEGITPEKIHFVGNIMIDTLIRLLPIAETHWPKLEEMWNLDRYVLVTLHRPGNVDHPSNLKEILSALYDISREVPVIFPVHPRTRQKIIAGKFDLEQENLHFIDPLGYLDFLALENHASLVLTDSGGVQEETTYLGIPCLTLRPNTECPITIQQGTNCLVVCQHINIIEESMKRLNMKRSPLMRPELWDGKTASRIVKVFQNIAN